MYLSYLINIIESVIERVSVYWHTVRFTSGSYYLDAAFLTLLHHNHNLTSNHVFKTCLMSFLFLTFIFITVFRCFHYLHYGHVPPPPWVSINRFLTYRWSQIRNWQKCPSLTGTHSNIHVLYLSALSGTSSMHASGPLRISQLKSLSGRWEVEWSPTSLRSAWAKRYPWVFTYTSHAEELWQLSTFHTQSCQI